MKAPRFLLGSVAVYGFGVMLAVAQAPSGTMTAEPNPCRIESGQRECTSFIRWQTRGVQHAKVYVTAEGRHADVEKEFSTMANCEGQRCRAPWVKYDTKYLFQLFDFSKGTRGPLLASVTVTATAVPWGSIRAHPNPCKVGAGRNDCEVAVDWEAHGVQQARVFVTSQGKKAQGERDFGNGLTCEGKCLAPWIDSQTKYVFQLFDYSKGSRGALLGSVTVTGQK